MFRVSPFSVKAIFVSISNISLPKTGCEYFCKELFARTLYLPMYAAGPQHILARQTSRWQWILRGWKIHLSLHLFIKREDISAGMPPEIRCSHARQPAATLPTRFSIKQANNTIPTPINKWLFLNKVLYTNPLAEATHHILMGTLRRSKLCLSSLPSRLPLFFTSEQSKGLKICGGSWNHNSSYAFTSSLYSRLLVKVQRHLCFMIDSAIKRCCPYSFSSIMSSTTHTNSYLLC